MTGVSAGSSRASASSDLSASLSVSVAIVSAATVATTAAAAIGATAAMSCGVATAASGSGTGAGSGVGAGASTRAGGSIFGASLPGTKASVVVGVSCNPVTFARDARVLIDAGFRLERVTPVAKPTADGVRYEVEAVPTGAGAGLAGLRPGLQGVAQIELTSRPLLQRWALHAWHWLRMLTWTWL